MSQTKPFEANRFHGKPCRACGSTLRYTTKGKRCVDCALSGSSKYKGENKDQIKVRNSNYRKNNPDVLARYYEENKVIIQFKSRESYTANREANLATKKKYFQDNRDMLLAKNAKWRRENPEKAKAVKDKWLAENKDAHSAYMRNYRQINKEAINAKCMERHCKKLQRMPAWADKQAIKQFYENRPEGMAVDHIIPLQGKLVSGLHIAENLQYLTQSDNSKKRNKFEPLFIIAGDIQCQ